ncbi:hypothetical protein BCR43DRAFT_489393, partial [Syncephalastrum racemosum]
MVRIITKIIIIIIMLSVPQGKPGTLCVGQDGFHFIVHREIRSIMRKQKNPPHSAENRFATKVIVILGRKRIRTYSSYM